MNKFIFYVVLILFFIPITFAAETLTTKIYVNSSSTSIIIYDEDKNLITSFSKASEFTDVQYFFNLDYDPDCETFGGDFVCNASVTCPSLPPIPSCPSFGNVSFDCPAIPACPPLPQDNTTSKCLELLSQNKEVEDSTLGLDSPGVLFFLIVGSIILVLFNFKKIKTKYFSVKNAQLKNYEEQRNFDFNTDEKPHTETPPSFGGANEQTRPDKPPQTNSNETFKKNRETYINDGVLNKKKTPVLSKTQNHQPKQISKQRMKELDQKIRERFSK